jgi:hypothetical protein
VRFAHSGSSQAFNVLCSIASRIGDRAAHAPSAVSARGSSDRVLDDKRRCVVVSRAALQELARPGLGSGQDPDTADDGAAVQRRDCAQRPDGSYSDQRLGAA